MNNLILGLYIFFMSFIFCYSIIQGHLIILYIKYKKKRADSVEEFTDSFIPYVTIQLPIYNEKYVIDRLINQVIKIDYPIDKLEIQILDDSDDETLEIVKKKVELVKTKSKKKLKTKVSKEESEEINDHCCGHD